MNPEQAAPAVRRPEQIPASPVGPGVTATELLDDRHGCRGLHQRRLRRAVWSEGGCDSWYLDADGVNRTLWPGFTFEYWARTRRARRADYQVTGS